MTRFCSNNVKYYYTEFFPIVYTPTPADDLAHSASATLRPFEQRN
jgi:hypothetical protein